MDETLTPVVIDGKLYLFTPAQMLDHELKQKRVFRETNAAKPPNAARRVSKLLGGAAESHEPDQLNEPDPA